VQRNIDIALAKEIMRAKADIDLVRRQNRHIVLETLRLHGPMPRVDLGKITGLSPASITSIANQLLAEKAMLELEDEAARDPSQRGRPTVRLGLNPEAARVVAMKISIDGLELALANFAGEITARKTFPFATYTMGAEVFAAQTIKAVHSFLKDQHLHASDIARIGIATQGLADSRLGVIAWSPAFKAHNIPVVGPLEAELGVPCSLANDANMIAEGVMARDRYNYTGTAAVVFMGYGVGMGLIIDGAVYHGATGAAAEFGHMNHVPGGALCRCGRAGCLEAYAADYGILRSAEDLPDDTAPPSSAVDAAVMRALEQAARAGDSKAVQAYQRAGRAIGFGLARLIALLNPDRIVLSGPGTRALDLIEPALRAAIEEGVVAELRSQVKIESVPIDTDMIITGTIDAALRHLDSEIFASGRVQQTLNVLESVN
jgi:predicted NBD/HSP70 family sugar kinase